MSESELNFTVIAWGGMYSRAKNQTQKSEVFKKRQNNRMIESPNLFITFITTFFTGNSSHTFLCGGSDKIALLIKGRPLNR